MFRATFVLLISAIISGGLYAQTSLTTLGTAYTQNFDALSNSAGSTTNVLSISGWFMTETGGGARDNEQYGVDTGSSTTGDTYSYGSAAASDRAIGALRSGTLIPNFGAAFTNNTGVTVVALDISFTGEQWRLGTISRTDQLNFEYSTNATDLTTGTWTGVSALNFLSPFTAVAGARDGNAAGNRTALSTTINGLSIANGATFWIRWADTDASGADDGLAVDDFSLTPHAPEINLQGNSLSIVDGDATPSLTDHTDFGSQDMCSGTVIRTFTIQNTGSSNLTLSNPTLSGTNAADFSVTANPSTPVSSAGSTTFQVTFDPSASGTRTATVTITNNDFDESTYNFDIQGTGTDGTPNADDPADVTVCDSYTLPALTVGNYFTGIGGTGTALSAGNNITSSQTIYVYAVNGSCTDENSFDVTINTTPTADDPADVTACDSYTLPALTVGNYFTGAGGTGTALSAGNNITSTQTIYVYAETGTTPNCTDENSFDITINTTPTADDPADVTACDSYTLPALTVGNYFTGAGGTGTALSAGNNITSTQTIYVYAETGTTPNCTDENSFDITINTTPTADDPADVTACDSYTLPALTVGNYFTGTGGTGTALSAGNNITSTQTIYVYAETGTTPNCTDENSFDITINTTPTADDPADVTACDSYTLPALTVGNYFTGAGGTGTALSAGNNITSTQTIYVYAETGTTPNCTDENSFDITINTTPTADDPADVTACDSYTLPALTVGNYFTGAGGTGTALSAGNNITSTQTIYVYAETGTTPNCTDENSFDITINTTPTADDPADVTACDSYTLPALTVGNYFTGAGGTGTALSAGNNITSTQTIYVYAETGTTPNCWNENSFDIIIQNCSELVPANCGMTLNIMEKVLSYTSVPGATNYEILVEGPGPYSQNLVRGSTNTTFKMSWFSGLAYNTTYTVKIRAEIGGALWTNYGDVCNITTPAAQFEPKLNSDNCGRTLTTWDDVLEYRIIYEATDYEIWVQGPSSYNSTKLRNNNLTTFKMDWFTGLKYATTYTVKIRAYVNGAWTTYGGACNVTTPPVPLTQLIPGDCGITLGTYDEILEYSPIVGASDYEMWVEGPSSYSSTMLRNNNRTTFRLSWFSGLTINTTYTVKVRSYVNGIWSAYGSPCNVTTAGTLSMQVNNEDNFKGSEVMSGLGEVVLETYPNPNNGSFTISSSHEGVLNIINELGQKIRTVEILKENNYQAKVEGLESGVYFVGGTIDNDFFTKKIIVK